MRKLDRRVHLLLDEGRHRKIAVEAKRRHVSIAAVIRDAIDRLPGDEDRRRIAIASVLTARPMAVPAEPAALRRELDDARDLT